MHCWTRSSNDLGDSSCSAGSSSATFAFTAWVTIAGVHFSVLLKIFCPCHASLGIPPGPKIISISGSLLYGQSHSSSSSKRWHTNGSPHLILLSKIASCFFLNSAHSLLYNSSVSDLRSCLALLKWFAPSSSSVLRVSILIGFSKELTKTGVLPFDLTFLTVFWSYSNSLTRCKVICSSFLFSS